MLAALEKEEGEFVRPALIRALAAIPKDLKIIDVLMRDAMRGVDYFRSTVIEAIGDYKVTMAMPRLVEVAKIDGPLQDDAITAIDPGGSRRRRRKYSTGPMSSRVHTTYPAKPAITGSSAARCSGRSAGRLRSGSRAPGSAKTET